MLLMMRRFSFLAGALTVSWFALLGEGCSSDSPPPAGARAQGCVLNSDCNDPLSCTFGRCHAACNETKDCQRGERCVKLPTGNVCQFTDEMQCTYTSDCREPLKCAVDSMCRVACETERDCLATQKCVSHVCADGDQIDVRTGDLPHTNPQGGWNGVNDDGGVPPSDAGGSGNGDSDVSVTPPGDGASGAEVARPAQCSDAGPALLTFGPSNLPAALTIPDGIADFVYTRPTCSFDTDMPGWSVANCGTSIGAETRFQVITLSDGREATVLFAQSFTINAGANLTIVGQRPLIIAVNGKAEVNGTLTATFSATNSWYGGGAPGPTSVARVGISPIDTSLGGGRAGGVSHLSGIGAGGGGFCGSGGEGTSADDAGPGPAGGAPYGTASLIPLVGGSSGGSSEGAGKENHGGGAVEIVSGTSILIGDTGVINMGGGAYKANYGTGGGSGGAILLEAPSVTVRGVLAANGGAGTATTSEAQDGLASDQPAIGSRQDTAGTRRAGNGGAGAVANGGKAEPPPTGLSSGGGGGGVGRIRINTGCGGTLTVASSAVISPAESTGCYTKGALQ